MKSIRPGARCNRDLSTRRASKLGSERRRLHAKLLHRIQGDETVRPSRGAERRQGSGTTLHQGKVAGHSEIGADAIHRKVVGVRTLAVYAELSLIVERGWGHHYARREHN